MLQLWRRELEGKAVVRRLLELIVHVASNASSSTRLSPTVALSVRSLGSKKRVRERGDEKAQVDAGVERVVR